MISHKKFVKKFCKKCNICIDTKQTYFCRDMYVANSKKFTNRCFSKLRAICSSKIMEKLKDPNLIKSIFCSAKICNGCKKDQEAIDECSNMFCDQILQLEFTNCNDYEAQLKLNNDQSQSKYKKKKNEVKIETSFIFGGSDRWISLIGSIT